MRKDRRQPSPQILGAIHGGIINPTTGELLRQLTLNPDRDYQPQTLAERCPPIWI